MKILIVTSERDGKEISIGIGALWAELEQIVKDEVEEPELRKLIEISFSVPNGTDKEKIQRAVKKNVGLLESLTFQ